MSSCETRERAPNRRGLDAATHTNAIDVLHARERSGIMNTMRRFVTPLLLLMLGCSTVEEPTADIAPPQRPASTRALFVGNSFTFWRGGLWRQLKTLSERHDPPLGYTTDCVVRGGASLEVMWNKTKARRRIAEGAWDVVVLQGDIPETTVASFRDYAARFADAVRDVGARPILFMAWAYDRLDWISFDEILQAHQEAAAALHVEVAPVGLAWQNAHARRPELDMYGRDREHPSVAGSYLALMVIEATISGLPPVGHDPEEVRLPGLERIEPEDATFLQEVARDTIAQWRALTAR